MKKITPEEMSKLQIMNRGYNDTESSRSKVAEIVNEIKNMATGEILLLSNDDWQLKTHPRMRLRNILPDIKISIKTLKDKTGWVIIKS